MKISFLIPSKNRLDLLKRAIFSILAQQDSDIEIVVSDNASQEDYKSYIDELSDPRIIYNRLPEPVSVTQNWNNALALSTGDYILMLGDDDALTPNFAQTVRPFISTDGPDLIYLAAYHYAYPNVLSFKPEGYLAVVRNSEFLIDDADPFCLTRQYARDLAASVLDFQYRIGFNAQHFLLKSSFIKQFAKDGGIYQSPYPDTFSAMVSLTHAQSILVVPRGVVIIGISPKSFGAYYFSNRHDEGFAFLANAREETALRNSLSHEILPGDRNNTNWLIAAEAAKRLTGLALKTNVNIARYRALQMVSVLRDRYLTGNVTDNALDELRSKLTPIEKYVFDLLKVAIEVTSQIDKVILIEIFTALNGVLAQFVKARIKFLDIGAHQTISDAFSWLANVPNAWSIETETEIIGPSKLIGERTALIAERDALIVGRDALIAERDALIVGRERLWKNRFVRSIYRAIRRIIAAEPIG